MHESDVHSTQEYPCQARLLDFSVVRDAYRVFDADTHKARTASPAIVSAPPTASYDVAIRSIPSPALRVMYGNFPAPAAWAAARRLEEIARGGELGESLAACAALDAEIERLVPTLREVLGEIVGRSEGSSPAPTA